MQPVCVCGEKWNRIVIEVVLIDCSIQFMLCSFSLFFDSQATMLTCQLSVVKPNRNLLRILSFAFFSIEHHRRSRLSTTATFSLRRSEFTCRRSMGRRWRLRLHHVERNFGIVPVDSNLLSVLQRPNASLQISCVASLGHLGAGQSRYLLLLRK